MVSITFWVCIGVNWVAIIIIPIISNGPAAAI